jgi:hypothetical protein
LWLANDMGASISPVGAFGADSRGDLFVCVFLWCGGVQVGLHFLLARM